MLIFPVLFICASVSGCGTGSAKPGIEQEFDRAFAPFPENTAVSYLGPGGTYTEEDAQFFRISEIENVLMNGINRETDRDL